MGSSCMAALTQKTSRHGRAVVVQWRTLAKTAKAAALPVRAAAASIPIRPAHSSSGKHWWTALIHPAQQDEKMKSTSTQQMAKTRKLFEDAIVPNRTVNTVKET